MAGAITNVSGNIGKDLTVFSGTSIVSGPITEDVRVFANKSTISDYVKGEIVVYADSSNIDEELVTGEVYEHTDLNENINVDTQKTNIFNLNRNNTFSRINVFSILVSFVGMYIVGIVLIYLAPIKTLQIEKKVIGSTEDFLFSLLIGLGITVLVPLPLLMLSLTVVGIPLAVLICGVLLFMSIFGVVWVESAIGQKILSTTEKKDEKRLLSLLIGRGLTTVVKFIPVVGWGYRAVLSMTAIGAMVRMKYDAFKSVETKKGKK